VYEGVQILAVMQRRTDERGGMTRRHGRARSMILLSGWLLVHPPVVKTDHHAYALRLEAPIGMWKPAARFDTASACEQERDRRVTAMWDDAAKAAGAPDEAVGLWRCVPVDGDRQEP